VVIGAGSAGLTAAIDLALKGHRVTVVESQGVTGGKMRTIRVAGLDVDSGPTVLTMRWVFEELFRDAGKNLDDAIQIQRADVLARHAWPDGSSLDLYADMKRSTDAIRAFAGPIEADAYARFMAHAKKIYEVVQEPFLKGQRPTPASMLRDATRMGIAGLAAIDGMTTLHKRLRSFFKDERLIQLFGRYATYVGSSPFECPATLALIAHVEHEGVHFVKGGMRELVRALETLARELDVAFVTGEPVTRIRIENGSVTGVETRSHSIDADAVVYAGDTASLAHGLLGEEAKKALPKYSFEEEKRSLSALTISMVAETRGFKLAHHNVFFQNGSQREFSDLFNQRTLPSAPSVYICAQDRQNGEAELTKPERLFFIINAPANGQSIPTRTISECQQAALSHLAKLGLDLKPIEWTTTTPADFEARFPRTGGALYGIHSHETTASLKRPGARTPVRGLYLAGGSTHPGAGVPMSSLSGRLAVKALQEDSTWTRSYRKTGTGGYM
jgi:1-hydroxycarotenoid 3,4-desaturase